MYKRISRAPASVFRPFRYSNTPEHNSILISTFRNEDFSYRLFLRGIYFIYYLHFSTRNSFLRLYPSAVHVSSSYFMHRHFFRLHNTPSRTRNSRATFSVVNKSSPGLSSALFYSSFHVY